MATFAMESRRNEERLRRAIDQASFGALSGAVGTYATLSPELELEVLDELGLGAEPASTQVVARDRHADLVTQMAVAASSLDRLATELRHLQRTEVREAEEAFTVGQKGSSAMPHKRNPVLSENVTGLARLVRAAVVPALENVALWHERDISHSSVERVIAPDTTVALDFALNRMAEIVEKLVVYPDKMRRNLESQGGLVYSQRVLLALTQAGLSRERAYRIVQRNAMKVWRSGEDFHARLVRDKEVTAALAPARLKEMFDPAPYLREVDRIFARVFRGPALAGAKSGRGRASTRKTRKRRR
jgi:adenylosuccinate lyase